MPSKAANAKTVSEFKRDTAKIAARLKRTGKPMVLTVGGKPAIVAQDIVAYRRLREAVAQAEKTEMKAFLEESRADIEAGRTIPALEFLDSLRRRVAPTGRAKAKPTGLEDSTRPT